jgi:hypothetical protein
MLEESHLCFHKAADVLRLQDNVHAILLTPRRSAKGDIICDPIFARHGLSWL